MVEAFEAAWNLLKARSGMGGDPFIGRDDYGQRVNNPRQGPITASESTDDIYRRKRLNRDTPYLTSFTNVDGSPSKRRTAQTPAFDKSRFITDMHNMGQSGNPIYHPMGMHPETMSDEDRLFLSLFGDMEERTPSDERFITGEPRNEIDHLAETHGVSPEQARSMAMADMYSGSQHLSNMARNKITDMINPAYINREAQADERRVSYE